MNRDTLKERIAIILYECEGKTNGEIADRILNLVGIDDQVAFVRDPEHPERLPTAYPA